MGNGDSQREISQFNSIQLPSFESLLLVSDGEGFRGDVMSFQLPKLRQCLGSWCVIVGTAKSGDIRQGGTALGYAVGISCPKWNKVKLVQTRTDFRHGKEQSELIEL